MSPDQIKKTVEHELWEKLEAKNPQKVTSKQPKTKFKIDDHVRVSKAKTVFAKGYIPNWTEEVFVISKGINTSDLNQYKVHDDNNEEIVGSFMDQNYKKLASRN